MTSIKQGEDQGVSLAQQIAQGKKLQDSFEAQLPQLRQTVRSLSGSDAMSADPVQCASSSSGTALGAAQCQFLLVQQMIEITKGTQEIMECHLSAPAAGSAPKNSRILGHDALAKLQSKPIDDALKGLLGDGAGNAATCADAQKYRDGQLLKDFDTAMAQYDIYHQGKLRQEDIRASTVRLLDDSWWAGSTGGEIAVEVKHLADLFNGTFGYLYPEEYATQVFGKVVQSRLALIDKSGQVAGGMATAVQQDAKSAAIQLWIECAKDLLGSAGSLAGMAQSAYEYHKTKDEMTAYKSTVQVQVRAINRRITTYEEKMKSSQEKANGITDLVQRIDAECGQLAQTPAPLTVAPPK